MCSAIQFVSETAIHRERRYSGGHCADAALATDDLPEQRPQAGRIADLAALGRMSGPMRPYDVANRACAVQSAALRIFGFVIVRTLRVNRSSRYSEADIR
jgi:hypothetical protein